MHRCGFLQGDNSQRIAVVESIEKEPFFATLKAATVRGYYSSKIGIHDEMDYKGNTLQQGEYSGFLPPHVAFPSNPRERLAVASWPFRKLVDPKKGTLPLLDFPQMIVDRFGVHGVELLDEHFLSTDAAYLDKLRAAVAKCGSRIVNIPVGRLGGSFYDADAEKRKHVVVDGEALDRCGGRGGIAERARACCCGEESSECRVRGGEFEGGRRVWGDARMSWCIWRMTMRGAKRRFFWSMLSRRRVRPWLRALPDFCNSMLLERGDDYNYKAVQALFEHAYGICHVKDSEQDGKKMFHVDLGRTFEIARAAGYRGYFSMEYDAEGDPFAAYFGVD